MAEGDVTKVVRTVVEYFGGDEPFQTSFGPVHYINVRFLEDDERTASIGFKPQNLERGRALIASLMERPAEMRLEEKSNGNYKLVDFPGHRGKDGQMSTLEFTGPIPEGRPSEPVQVAIPGVAAATVQHAAPIDDAWKQRIEDKLDAIIELISIKDVLFGAGVVGASVPGKDADSSPAPDEEIES